MSASFAIEFDVDALLRISDQLIAFASEPGSSARMSEQVGSAHWAGKEVRKLAESIRQRVVEAEQYQAASAAEYREEIRALKRKAGRQLELAGR